jgi:hypothetical protein
MIHAYLSSPNSFEPDAGLAGAANSGFSSIKAAISSSLVALGSSESLPPQPTMQIATSVKTNRQSLPLQSNLIILALKKGETNQPGAPPVYSFRKRIKVGRGSGTWGRLLEQT